MFYEGTFSYLWGLSEMTTVTARNNMIEALRSAALKMAEDP